MWRTGAYIYPKSRWCICYFWGCYGLARVVTTITMVNQPTRQLHVCAAPSGCICRNPVRWGVLQQLAAREWGPKHRCVYLHTLPCVVTVQRLQCGHCSVSYCSLRFGIAGGVHNHVLIITHPGMCWRPLVTCQARMPCTRSPGGFAYFCSNLAKSVGLMHD